MIEALEDPDGPKELMIEVPKKRKGSTIQALHHPHNRFASLAIEATMSNAQTLIVKEGSGNQGQERRKN